MSSKLLLKASTGFIVCLAACIGLSKPVQSQESQGNQAPAPEPPAQAVPAAAALQVVEGPFLSERQALRDKIKAAEDKGIGIKPYMMAFEALEVSVRTGAAGEGLQKRLESISRGLDEQFKRGDVLKRQRPAPPISASSPPPSAMSGGALGGLPANGNKGDLVNAIKNKWFGGEIPDSIKSKIPSDIDPNKLKQEDVDSLLKQLK